ncbi:YugN-like family protein [Metabacillus sp. GX 13764]|uniref:YugN family protein n=1 Tax=Metabacillus kandeliae TaxID=2900151 RepID=UPI001E4BD691|nr:YugN family protein [Metabacillus kandeliae]MCD7033926.1 YugN-like family protein [Metabacillus kandeliae]
MKFEGTGLESMTAELVRLDDLMENHGMLRAGQWDYERVTYDKKFDYLGNIFYLRIMGYAIEGDVGSRRAVIQFLTPLLGKYYYPHGVEYGEDEEFPPHIIQSSETLLKEIKEEIEQLAVEG